LLVWRARLLRHIRFLRLAAKQRPMQMYLGEQRPAALKLGSTSRSHVHFNKC
jgi:hypothetical protein